MSLIEILVVVVILAMLTTMVIGVASRVDTQAKEKSVESMFTMLDSALQEYHEFTNRFPEQKEVNFANAAVHSEFLYGELETVPASQTILHKIDASRIENKHGTAQTPPEIYDPWGTPLDYQYAAGQNFPRLISAGPDKAFGTQDDIENR